MRFRALASDYDGTLAHDGRVEPATWDAMRALRASGRLVVLVTGRELSELLALLPDPGVFDRIVAENGALIYEPATREVRMLGAPPSAAFVAELRARGVTSLAVGRVIVATWEPFHATVLAAIADLGLDLQVICNKGAVMILPAGVDKASGLVAVCAELGLAPSEVVAVGDGENDRAMLAASGMGVAVANALPSVRAVAGLVVGDHGRGVTELAYQMIATDLLRPFVFRGPDRSLELVAADLAAFLELGDRVDDATWTYHLARGDYARWVRDQLADQELADAIGAVEGAAPDESRAAIRRAVNGRQGSSVR